MGRPSEFTQAISDEICERLADGESLRRICMDEHMPSKATVFRWLASMPAFQDQYAIAREAQAETQADELTDIADELPPKDAFGKVDGGAVQHQRLRIETRKWTAAKLKPKKYGDRIGVDHSGTVGVERLTDEQLLARIATLQTGPADDPQGA